MYMLLALLNLFAFYFLELSHSSIAYESWAASDCWTKSVSRFHFKLAFSYSFLDRFTEIDICISISLHWIILFKIVINLLYNT